ncbi:MAG: hypothetical protein U1G07_21430 [Verrucomicrobiota bacterium]
MKRPSPTRSEAQQGNLPYSESPPAPDGGKGSFRYNLGALVTPASQSRACALPFRIGAAPGQAGTDSPGVQTFWATLLLGTIGALDWWITSEIPSRRSI